MPAEDRLPSILSLEFIENLHAAYLRDPGAVPERWRRHFQSLAPSEQPPRGWKPGPSFTPRGLFDNSRSAEARSSVQTTAALLQDRVDQLVESYRRYGHRSADIDPLGRRRPSPPELDPAFFGLGEDSMALVVSCDTIPGAPVRTVREILEQLRNTYCRSIGVESTHIDDPDVRKWLRDRMEVCENRTELDHEEQVRIFARLSDALVFEEFIQKKYVGAKRFSLEGAESLLPLLDLAIERAGEQGIEEIVLGMAHRGRLNVLVNILEKSAQEIFREFEDDNPEAFLGGGDVKYHLGHSTDRVTASGQTVHLSLCFNPSHLEFVGPVAQGRLRAKQDRAGDSSRSRGMVVLVHGDAAFAGEGVVQEALNLSQLDAYTTGGTLHVIVNNQIGFTTPPDEGRSSDYATGVARLLEIPIFHVNGEDPEAVAQVVRLSMDFRRKYRRDVVIDMHCYRLHGHYENDEPSLTQPEMYRAIEERGTVRGHYLERLLALKGLAREDADRIASERRGQLQAALEKVRRSDHAPSAPEPRGVWSGYRGGLMKRAMDVETGVERERLLATLEQCTRIPVDFHPHDKIRRLLKSRQEMTTGERPVDWATAELLAFGTLALEGHRVRMSGQDAARGTFSQRHATLHDVEDGRSYMPLEHVAPEQATVEIHNSPLSEAGVLAFEYGYSLDCPDGLVAWEAQFGDFANAAQVIIDQFLTSAEDKWRRLSGLVLLLPHGFEGQGPEHSSARLERFLTLAAEHNIQIVCPTTPAQHFHCLRRQVIRSWRKPLVVLTPKSLLRNKQVVSTLEDFEGGGFRRVLPDPRPPEPGNVVEVLLCTGKVFYDLESERQRREHPDRAILRVEELYPFPSRDLRSAVEGYPDGVPLAWVQEEPENMGAWRYVGEVLREELPGRRLRHVSRPESASPATGAASSHRLEAKELLGRVFHDEVRRDDE